MATGGAKPKPSLFSSDEINTKPAAARPNNAEQLLKAKQKAQQHTGATSVQRSANLAQQKTAAPQPQQPKKNNLSYLKAMKAEEKTDEPPLIKALKNPGDLPSLPTVLTEIQQIINDPKSSGQDLKAVIEKDVAMTASVLKLINSAFYAIPGGVSNLQRAIAYLGYDAIYQVALTVSVIKSFKLTDFPNFKLKDFWVHSLAVASWAEEVAKTIKYPKPSDAFTAGLLHDLGKVFIAKEDSDGMMKIVTQCFDEGKTFTEVETNHIPLPHSLIGERLCKHWNLPRNITLSMRWHHFEDVKVRREVVSEDNQFIDMIYVSNAMAHRMKLGNSGFPPGEVKKPLAVFKRLMIKDPQVTMLQKKIEQRMKNAESFLALL